MLKTQIRGDIIWCISVS